MSLLYHHLLKFNDGNEEYENLDNVKLMNEIDQFFGKDSSRKIKEIPKSGKIRDLSNQIIFDISFKRKSETGFYILVFLMTMIIISIVCICISLGRERWSVIPSINPNPTQ